LSSDNHRLVSTERERLEQLVSERTQALEQSREMFRLIAESTHAVPFTLDLSRGYFPYIGTQGVANLQISSEEWGRPGVLDAALPRALHAELRRQLDDTAVGPFEFMSEIRLPGNRSAEVRWMGTCEVTTDSKILRGLMHDVTDVRRLARELTAAQKLESVGRLAAGVAHEINTPVQFVADNVEFVSSSMACVVTVIQAYRELKSAVQSTAAVSEAALAVERAESAADIGYILENIPAALTGATEGLRRIATIVQSMKEFAHPDQTTKTAVDLNHAIQSTLVIARNEYKYVAELETDFQELPPVHCYLGEVNQVVLNLLVNAAHAIGDVVRQTGTMGKLRIGTRTLGEEVEISIGDTGTGIPAAVREKIFDPFFTTKELGKGTGQGLAIARSVIVNKHGGTLRFDTETGKGTTFFIRLPVGKAGSAVDLAA
jgi:signal transduction histidine kinase